MHSKRIQNRFFAKLGSIARFFSFSRPETTSDSVPTISDRTSMSEISSHYPAFETLLLDRFGLELNSAQRSLSLNRFCQQMCLPPAQVVFMEFQLSTRAPLQPISAPDLKQWIDSDPRLVLLDVRESWEQEWGTLPRSLKLDASTLEKVLAEWPKDTPLAVYCHYGIRSRDAASYLFDQGFTQARPLTGGVEAWSEQVDEAFPKYPGHPC